IKGVYNTYPEGKIYANGRMQSEISVYYDIKDNYEFIDVTLKRLYTEEELPGVSESYNGYVTDIRLAQTKKNNGDRTTKRVVLYLSSNTPGVEQVCVEAQAKNTVTGSIVKSNTCSNSSNNASISVEKVNKLNYSQDDFKLIYESESNTHDGDDPNWLRISVFDPVGFELYDIWDQPAADDDYALGYNNGQYEEAYKVLGNCEKCADKYGFYRLWMTPDKGSLFYGSFGPSYPTYYIPYNELSTTSVMSDWSPSRYNPKEHIMFLEAWNPTVVSDYATTYLAPYAFGKTSIDPQSHYFYISDAYGHHMKIGTRSLSDGLINDGMFIVTNI
ncbi:hypothetical protein, partial [Vibrio jasicida]|uniref:hypothetical protein n=1 Tax=Vibrio jasicida TaxID=766224 RepID=UPI0015E29237